MSAIEELCTPDIEFDWSRRLLDPTITRGYEGIRRFFEEVDDIFDEIAFEEEEILEFGDEVLMVNTGFRFYQTKEDAMEDLASEAE